MSKVQWNWWRAALAGTFGSVREAEPQSGYYRAYTGDPVAIWRDSDEATAVHMLVAGEIIDDKIKQGRHWLSVAKSPVARASYLAREKDGAWPSDPPPVKTVEPAKMDLKPETAVPPAKGSTPGDNVGGDASEYNRMRAEIQNDVGESRAYLLRSPIKSKDDADKAEDWGKRIAKAAKEADAARKRERAPLKVILEEIDAKWNSVIDPANEQALALRGSASSWAAAESKRLQDAAIAEARKAHEEQMRIQREEAAARRSEAAMAAPMEDQTVFDIEALPFAPPPVPVTVAPKIPLGTGRDGNRRSVTAKAPETATIENLRLAATHFADQHHPELIALIQKLADRAIKARAEIPGVRFSWEREAVS